jgi:hypothetical protein
VPDAIFLVDTASISDSIFGFEVEFISDVGSAPSSNPSGRILVPYLKIKDTDIANAKITTIFLLKKDVKNPIITKIEKV